MERKSSARSRTRRTRSFTARPQCHARRAVRHGGAGEPRGAVTRAGRGLLPLALLPALDAKRLERRGAELYGAAGVGAECPATGREGGMIVKLIQSEEHASVRKSVF